MMVSRRALLGSTALVALVGVAGCVSAGGSLPQQLITDAGLVLSGLEAVVKGLGAAVPASVADKINTYVAEIQAAISALSGAISTTAAAPTVQNIVNLVEQAISLIPAGVLPAPLSEAVMAIQVLLPVLLAYVGAVSTPPAQMRAAVSRMTPDEARTVLRAL